MGFESNINKREEGPDVEKDILKETLPPDFLDVIKEHLALAKRIAIGTVLVAASFVGYDVHKMNEGLRQAGEDIGLDLKELANNTESTVSVQVYSSDSHQYVVHIGQSHYRPGMEGSDIKSFNEILESQKKIEKIIERLSEVNSGATNVFCEGLTKESDLADLNNIKKLIAGVGQVESGPEYYQKIDELLFPASKSSFGLTFEQAIIKAYTIEKILGNMKVDSQTSDTHLKKLKSFVDNVSKSAPPFSVDELLLIVIGADLKMYLDGKINLLPSEGTSYDSPELHDKIGKIECEIDKVKDTSHPVEALKSVGSLINFNRSGIDKVIFDDRQKETVSIVGNETENGQQKVIPLVFGKAHNFTGDIRKYNETHQDHQLNLLSIDTVK